MKKLIILIAFAPYLLFAEVEFKSEIQIVRTSSKLDHKLKRNDAMYEFKFESNGQRLLEANVYYAIDGLNSRQLSKNSVITIPTKAGLHIFQFFYNDQFLEVYSDSLTIEARHHDKYTIKLNTTSLPNVSLKPIIYLYPTQETKVSIAVHPKGEFYLSRIQ